MPTEMRRRIEKAARLYLDMRGFKVHEQNWGLGRNKIDVIASKDRLIHFIEIVYIADPLSGESIEVLTESKLNKIQSAAEAWIFENKYPGGFVYSSLQLTGPEMSVVSFNESVL